MKDFILNILYWLFIVIAYITAIPIMVLAIIVCIILLPFALIVEAFESR